jgi:hypothetical protein
MTLRNSATYSTHLDCQLDTTVAECPRWWPWTAVWSGGGNKLMRKHQQGINGFLPWGQGHGSSLMAATLSPHITSHFPFTYTGCVLPPANAPHNFHNTNPRPSMAKLTEDCFPQKCWRKGHFLQPFGHSCHVDRCAASPCHWPSCMDKVVFCFSTGRTDELLIWLGQSAQWPAECTRLYSGQSLFYTPHTQ